MQLLLVSCEFFLAVKEIFQTSVTVVFFSMFKLPSCRTLGYPQNVEKFGSESYSYLLPLHSNAQAIKRIWAYFCTPQESRKDQGASKNNNKPLTLFVYFCCYFHSNKDLSENATPRR